MSPFIPKLADHTSDLRLLLRKDSEWQWTPSHQQAFDAVKSLICADCTLTYFDPKKPTVLQVDASLKGLGAALIQQGKPVAYASKALTDAETRYANIERELLAVVFGCTRFHTYVYGSKFTVESDHKPLEVIQRKSLASTPPRLQRMMLRLQPYDCEIVYKPGREMLIADAMSRLNPSAGKQIDLDTAIYAVQFTTEKLNDLKVKTRQDPVLNPLMETIVNGWPQDPKQLPKCLRCFYSCKDELSVDDGIIIKGDRIFIPAVLQEETLNKIHNAHQGITKCQLRAKSCVYWTGINKDIEDMVNKCHICQEHQRSQAPEPLMPHDIPPRPWHTVGTDLFHFEGAEFLIIADYYAKFPIVRKLGKTTSMAVITQMQQIFGEYGIPCTIISDNGPQYASEDFRKFAEDWGINHTTSSPRFPQSNGFIERTIQSVKATLKKARQAGTDVNMALLCLRSTPIDSKLPSPGELLNKRKLRNNLPVKIQNAEQNKAEVYERLSERQQKQKDYHDKHALPRELPPLVIGQHVTIQNQDTGRWTPAVVVAKCPEPRSYIVQTPNGTQLRRNRNHLRDIEPTADNQTGGCADDAKPRDTQKSVDNGKSDIDNDAYKTRSGREVKTTKRLIEST